MLLPGKSHGRRSLVSCSPWGREESDRTERLHFHFSLSCVGEGNGSPLQYSCLENPRDGRAWWAAIYGVAQSRTQLSDFTFMFHFHVSLSYIREGDGSPLQCSCLENPRDGRACWGAAYTVRGLSDKEYACNAGHAGNMHLISGSIRSPGIGNGTPLQSSCLGNPMNIGAWWTTVRRVTNSNWKGTQVIRCQEGKRWCVAGNSKNSVSKFLSSVRANCCWGSNKGRQAGNLCLLNTIIIILRMFPLGSNQSCWLGRQSWDV